MIKHKSTPRRYGSILQSGYLLFTLYSAEATLMHDILYKDVFALAWIQKHTEGNHEDDATSS